MRRWKEEEYPAIAAAAAAEGASIYFADEAGIRSDHHAGTAWAPVGQTPVVKVTGGRLKLFFLPGYSPELDPDEWVWKNVKNDRIARSGEAGGGGVMVTVHRPRPSSRALAEFLHGR